MANPNPARGAPDEPARDPAVREVARALLTLHLGLSPLLFCLATHDGFEFPKVLFLIAAVAVVLGLVLSGSSFWSSWGSARSALQDPLAPGLVLFVVSVLVSTAFSLSFWTSLLGAENSFAGLGTLLGYVVLFVVTRGLIGTTAEARRLLAAPVLGAAIASTYGLLQVLGRDPVPWARVAALGVHTRPFGTLGHPNFLAGYLVMALPLVVLFAERAWVARRRWAALGLGTTATLAALLIVLSASRGAWLAALAVLVILGLGLARRAPRRAIVGLVMGLVVTVLLLYGARAVAPGAEGLVDGLKHRVSHIADSPTRLHIWGAAWRMFEAHPVTGVGPDAFQIAFQRERRIEYWLTEWGATPQRAHNEALHVLATQGLLGAAALGLLAVGLVGAGRRSWSRAGPERRHLLTAAVAGLVAYTVQVTFSFTVAAVGSLVVTLAAVLAGPTGRADTDEPDPAWPHAHTLALAVIAILGVTTVALNLPPSASPLVPSVLLGAAVLVTASLVRAESAASAGEDATVSSSVTDVRAPTSRRILAAGLALSALWLGVVRPLQASLAARQGGALMGPQPADGLRHLERATERDSLRPVHWRTLARARLQTATRRAPGTNPRELLGGARLAAERARDLVPASANSHAALGTVLVAEARARGDADVAVEALACFDRAIELDPANPYLRVKAAEAARLLGRPDLARSHLDEALELLPEFGAALSERALLARDQGQVAEAVAWQERSVAGLHRDENDLVNAVANLASAYFVAGRLDEALPVARRAVELQDSADLRFNLGRILEALNRRAEAEVEYRRALGLQPGHRPARAALARLEFAGQPRAPGDPTLVPPLR